MAIVDRAITAEGQGWAAGAGLRIYRLDGAIWRVALDDLGSILDDPFNAIAVIGDQLYFAGSMATMIAMRDGTFVRYMDRHRMSASGLRFDLTHLVRIAAAPDGSAVAVGGFGSPIERSAAAHRWREMDGARSDAPIVSAAFDPAGGLWFGTAAGRKRGGASFIRRSPDGESLAQSNVTSLSIWDIDFSPSGDGWAVSSYGSFDDPDKFSNIMQLVDGHWVVRCAIDGDDLRSVAAVSIGQAIAVGTSVVACTGKGAARSFDGLDGSATGVFRDVDGAVYVSTTKGVQLLAAGDNVLLLILSSPEEYMRSVVAHDGCVLAFGETRVWRGDASGWEIGTIPVAYWGMGSVKVHDAAVDTSAGTARALVSGNYDTVVGIDMTCGSPPDPGTVSAPAPSPSANSTPRAATRGRALLPLLLRGDR